MASDKPEYLFVDESGDPGKAAGNPIYILTGVHVPKASMASLRVHLASFRYHNNVNKELKDYPPFRKNPPIHQVQRFVEALVSLTRNGLISATTNWLRKATYKGPYLDPPDSVRFRNFQLRLLLVRHKERGYWCDNMDVVLDRFDVTEELYLNMRKYVLKTIWGLEPRPAHITIADSDYVGGLQLADIYTRLARQVIEGKASEWETELAGQLMDIQEQTTGLYS